MHSCPEQLLKLPSAFTCECLCVSWIWWSASPSKGYLQPRCPRRVLLSDTDRGRAVTPAMASWGTEASSHCVRGQTSQWSIKLITTGTGDYCFVTGPQTHSRSKTDKWTDFIPSHSEPHTMQNELTGRLTTPNGCLWWPHWPKSHLSVSLCFSFSYCFLISLSLTCYDPFYCLVLSHIAVICLVWDPCLSSISFFSLKVFLLSSLRLLGKAT